MAYELTPVSVRRDPRRRLPQLLGGLILYGVSMALQIEATLGLSPWDVLHEALHKITHLSFGTITAMTSVIVLLCWIPLRQRLGVGTVANVIFVSLSVDAALAVLPTVAGIVPRITFLTLGIVLNAVATAAYIGARLGPGPRDGLMTGLSGKTGISIRWVRTAIEIVVLATGWILGGTVGIGTVAYAVAIGPLAQLFLPWLSWRTRP